MKINTQTKIEELTENFIDSTKSGLQWYEHAEYLDKKRKWSGGDWFFLVFNSLNLLASATKTIDSGKELFNANRVIQTNMPPVKPTFNSLNLTPTQLFALNPSLYLLSTLPSKEGK